MYRDYPLQSALFGDEVPVAAPQPQAQAPSGDEDEDDGLKLEEVLALPQLPEKCPESQKQQAPRAPPPDWDPRKELFEQLKVMCSMGAFGPGVHVMRDVPIDSLQCAGSLSVPGL